MDIKNILKKLYEQNNLSQEEILYILDNIDSESAEELFAYAHKTRIKVYGLKVYMRGLIEFTNICKQNCKYCGIRRENKNAERFRLTTQQILECCREGDKLGFKTFVLQGGEDPYYTDDILVDIIKKIKALYPGHAVTLSLGERSYNSYKRLYDAGADRYLLRHETASTTLYKKIHDGLDFHSRRKCLWELKEIGYQTGAGFMVGLPWQTNEDLAKDLIFLMELEPAMVGIGPFIPHDDTPFGKFPGGTIEKTLVMIALTRLLLPKVLLPSTTAVSTIDPNGMEKALYAGANVVMPNLSPVSARSKYLLYNGKLYTGDEAARSKDYIESRIKSAGFEVDMGRGDALI